MKTRHILRQSGLFPGSPHLAAGFHTIHPGLEIVPAQIIAEGILTVLKLLCSRFLICRPWAVNG